jgi:hypothetical protein
MLHALWFTRDNNSPGTGFMPRYCCYAEHPLHWNLQSTADCPYAPGHPFGTPRFVGSLSDRQPAIVGGVVPEFQQLFVVLPDIVTV